MNTVMLSGSRHINGLPLSVRQRLFELVSQQVRFLVGDAFGADRAFQEVLASMGYGEVEVFTSLSEPRTNIGHWPVQRVDTGMKSKSAAMHTVKDRHMVLNADHGLVVWDGESTGSLANIIDFIDAQKSCHIWMPGEDYLSELDSQSQLEKLLTAYPTPASEARKRLATFHNRERRRESQPAPPELPF